MRIERRPPTEPFRRFLGQARGLIRVWAEYVGGVALFSFVFGPFAPLGFIAAILTIGLPIALATLWGMSLESELQWSERDEGPW